jgi:predicted DNA repair protein MutK
MIWVGGGIIVHGFEEFGLPAIGNAIHAAAETAGHAVPALDGVIEWLVAAAGSGLVGLALGLLIVAIHHRITHRHGEAAESTGT